jgi:hypothetical protein
MIHLLMIHFTRDSVTDDLLTDARWMGKVPKIKKEPNVGGRQEIHWRKELRKHTPCRTDVGKTGNSMTYILRDILSTLFPTVLVGAFLKTSDFAISVDVTYRSRLARLYFVKKDIWKVHPPSKRPERHSELHLCVSATNTWQSS